jgi:CII-binding regulator of phage lambda lysogenization HflD
MTINLDVLADIFVMVLGFASIIISSITAYNAAKRGEIESLRKANQALKDDIKILKEDVKEMRVVHAQEIADYEVKVANLERKVTSMSVMMERLEGENETLKNRVKDFEVDNKKMKGK